MARRLKCLMLGSGFSPLARRVWATEDRSEPPTDWVTLDCNPSCSPDVVFDLECIESSAYVKENRLPFADNTFDEIHAYEVIEHYGRQGDYRGFFTGFRELWRILKPGGHLCGTTPTGSWVWSDPGHTRHINAQTLTYLTKERYDGLGSDAGTDYRYLVDPCWWSMAHTDDGEHLFFIMTKVV